MRTLKLKMVIIVNDEGSYIVHGSSTETPAEMFKTVSPLWHLDPSTEDVHYAEVSVRLPEIEKTWRVIPTKDPDDSIQPS